jgi:hypothetical protein
MSRARSDQGAADAPSTAADASTLGIGLGSSLGLPGGVFVGSSDGIDGSTLGGGVGGAVGHGCGTTSEPLGEGISSDGTTPLSSGVGCGIQLNDGTGVWQLPPPSNGPQLRPYGTYWLL